MTTAMVKAGRTVRAAGLMLAVSAALFGASAQTAPPATERDLLTPPDLRTDPPAARPETRGRPRPIRHPAPADAASSARTPAQRQAGFKHPVDLGVVMRGGSATPHLVSPLGGTQAVRESGSAFGAGMRIGF